MELYVNEDSRDVDILTVDRSGSSALYQSFLVFSQFYLCLHGISFLNSWEKNMIGRYIPHINLLVANEPLPPLISVDGG